MEYLRNILLVAAGGAIGATLRYMVILSSNFLNIQGFWSTLAVNVVGSFFMGMLLAWLPETGDRIKLLIGTGLLGAFTTFSTFSADIGGMIQTKAWVWLAIYFSISVLGGLFAFIWGYSLMHHK